MRIVPMAALAAALAVSAVAPSFAQAPLLRPPGGGGGFHGGGPGGGIRGGGLGGGVRGGGGGQQFGGAGGRQFGNGPHPDGRRFVGGSGYNGGYRHRGYGAAVGAGVAGLAAGALIGGAIANQGYYGSPGYGYGGYGAPAYNESDEDDRVSGPVVADQEDDASPAGDSADYCAQRYRSYDRDSGTYLGFDGDRHPCP